MKTNKKITFAILIIITLTLSIRSVYADTIKFVECEYTQEYKDWLRMTNEERKNVLVPQKCKTKGVSFNNSFGNSLGSNITETETSSKFDLRDYNYVTSVKDQGSSGSCWTFSGMAAIESNALMHDMGEYDLSEAHTELATQNSLFESLIPFNRQFSKGGNYYVLSAYLYNRLGTVSEQDSPYSLVLNTVNHIYTPTLNDISNKKIQIYPNDTTTIAQEQGACNTNTMNSIKKYLLKEGALPANIHMALMTGEGNSYDENGDIHSMFLNGKYYYYNGSAYTSNTGQQIEANSPGNHAVAIVGWDDSVSKANFTTQPSRDGAWIVKNSYGEKVTIKDQDNNDVQLNMGDNGYFYVSYDDIDICTSSTGFYNLEKTVEDHSYHNEDLGFNNELIAKENHNYAYLANVFNRSSSESEILEKVTFYSVLANQQYEVFYSNSDNLNNKVKLYSGTTDHIGYTTINIGNANLTNDKFSIIVKYSKTDDGISIPVYQKDSLSITSPYKQDAKTGVSFYSFDNKEWAEFKSGTSAIIPIIRAYTNDGHVDVPEPVPDNGGDGEETIINDDQVEIESNPENEGLDNVGDYEYDEEITNPHTADNKNKIMVVITLISLVVAITFYSIHSNSKNESN